MHGLSPENDDLRAAADGTQAREKNAHLLRQQPLRDAIVRVSLAASPLALLSRAPHLLCAEDQQATTIRPRVTMKGVT